MGVKGSRPRASQVAAQIAARPPTVHGGRGRNLVGWCDYGPVGRKRGACDLRHQCGACEQDLLHETLPQDPTKPGGILLQSPPLAVAPRPQLSRIRTSFWYAADPATFPGDTAR